MAIINTIDASRAWHALPPADDTTKLRGDVDAGLFDAEAGVLRQAHGPNRIEGRPPRPAWLNFVVQFRNFLVIVVIHERTKS